MVLAMDRRILAFIIWVCALPAFGTDRLVPSQYATIEAALTVAQAGDVIILDQGTYSGPGNRDIVPNGKNVTIRSTDPANPAVVAATVINPQGSATEPHRAFRFAFGETAATVIDGLTVTGGWADSGGAIACENSAAPTIRNCVFTNNSATFYAGGIYCTGSAHPAISNCTFSTNATVKLPDGRGGLDGGAVYCYNSPAAISNCSFTNNTARSGGAIYTNASSLSISGCTFSANAAGSSGGAVTVWGGTPTIAGCLFYDNAANYSGGAISCEHYAQPTISKVTFSRNTAVMYGGGGIACNGTSTPTVENNILWDNVPTEIKVFSGTPAVTYCDVKGGWTGTGNLNADPLFADPDQNDFHLKSTAGRWDPAANGGAGGWVIDTVTSPCIDAGDPTDNATNEPGTNPVLDMGHFGNTAQASMPPAKVRLTVTVVGGHGTVSPNNQLYFVGTTVTLTAVPEAGYRVLAWTGTNNDPGEGSNTNTVTMDAEKTVTVQFATAPVQTFALTASVVDGHGQIVPQSGTFNINTAVPLTAIPDDGYKVAQWTGTDDDNSTADTNTVTMTADKTVTVKFEQILYTLHTTVVGEGTLTPETEDEGQTYPVNTVVNLTAAPKTGYRLKAWSGTDNDLITNLSNTVTMTANKTVTATFEPIPYTLSVSVTGGNGTVSSSPAGPTIYVDQVLIVTAVPNTGYRVKEWVVNGVSQSPGANSVGMRVAGNITVTVEFESITFTTPCLLTTSVAAGLGKLAPSSGIYDNLTVVDLQAFPDAGSRVKKWTGTDDDTAKTETNAVTMSDNKSVTVEFERYYTLTASVKNGHGTVSPTSGVFGEGELVTLTAVPDEGYRVKAWSGPGLDPAPGANSNSFLMNADKEITVEFELIPASSHTLTVSVVNGHGSASPLTGIYEHGTTVTLTAHPDADYRVKAWTGTSNDSATSNTNTVIIDADKQVTVEFELIRYTLTIVKTGAGTVDPEPGAHTYNIHTEVTLTASPAEHYQLESWSGTANDNITALTNTVKMDSNKSVVVNFYPETHKLTRTVEGGHGSIYSTPSGTDLPYNTFVTFTAVPDSGYRVLNWTGTDSDPGTGGTSNYLTLTTDRTVTVTFEPIPENSRTLIVHVNGGNGKVFPASGLWPHGATVPLTAIPDTDYHVKAWTNTDNDSSTETTNTVTLNDNTTVTVQFEKDIHQYQLTTTVIGGNGTVSPASGTYDEGTRVILTATPEPGYRVKAWTKTDFTPFTGSNTNLVTLTADTDVTVEFELIPTQTYCTLTSIVTGGNGSLQPASGAFPTGAVVQLTAVPDINFHVKSWAGTDNDNSTATTNTVTLSANKTVTLTLEVDPGAMYALVVDIPTGFGQVLPSGGSCVAGTTVTLNATPDPGYRVQAWSGTNADPSTGSNSNTVTMTADKTVTVWFEPIPTTTTPGDINGDQTTDIADVVLGMRMAVQLEITIGSQTYPYPYPDWLIGLGDLTGDGSVDVSDIVKLQRKAVGLE